MVENYRVDMKKKINLNPINSHTNVLKKSREQILQPRPISSLNADKMEEIMIKIKEDLKKN